MSDIPAEVVDHTEERTRQFIEDLYRNFLHAMWTQDKTARELFKEAVRPLVIQFNKSFICPMHKEAAHVCHFPPHERKCGIIPCIVMRPKE